LLLSQVSTRERLRAQSKRCQIPTHQGQRIATQKTKAQRSSNASFDSLVILYRPFRTGDARHFQRGLHLGDDVQSLVDFDGTRCHGEAIACAVGASVALTTLSRFLSLYLLSFRLLSVALLVCCPHRGPEPGGEQSLSAGGTTDCSKGLDDQVSFLLKALDWAWKRASYVFFDLNARGLGIW
jgi:hypothetical protein